MGLLFDAGKFEGISSLISNMISPPWESRSNLQEKLKPSIKKYLYGKLSSILVSHIMCKKLAILSLRIFLSDVLQSLSILTKSVIKCFKLYGPFMDGIQLSQG